MNPSLRLLPAALFLAALLAAVPAAHAQQPLIVLDGGDALEHGIVLQAGGSTVRGMAIVGFTGAAIRIEGPGGNFVEGNYLGVDPDGVTLRGNKYGVHIVDSRENTIGGDTEEARNVIGVPPSPAGTPVAQQAAGVFIETDAADANTIAGNYIGVSADGTAMLAEAGAPRSGVGVMVLGADSTVIGGLAPATGQAPGNVISGLQQGIAISNVAGPSELAAAFESQVLGNLIGTNAAGTDSLSNGTGVLLIGGALFTQVGGATLAEGNVISGNQAAGIMMTDGGSAGEPIPPLGSRIVGNTIGLAAGGLAPLGNLIGVSAGGEADGDGGQSPGVRGVVIGEPGYPRNLIAGNRLMQLFVFGAGYPEYAGPDATPEQIALSYVYVRNNYLGLLANGQVALSGEDRTPIGLMVAGGARAVVGFENGRNVIGGHQVGLYLVSQRNLVFSNYIGTDPDGLEARPNRYGLILTGGDNILGRPPADGQPYTGAFVLAWGNLVSGNDYAGMLLAPGIPAPVPGGSGLAARLAGLGGPDRGPARRGGDEGGPALLIGNRVGVSATGGVLPNGAAFAPDPDVPEVEVGGGVLAVHGDSYLLWNVIAGNVGDGLAVYGAPDPQSTDDAVAHLLGNSVGASPTADAGFLDLPNTRDGIFSLGGDVRVGLTPEGGGFPTPGGDVRNVVWNNGRNGVTTANFGRLYVANGSFLGNGGLGIDLGIAGPDGPGVPPGFLLPPGVFNPTLVVADGDSTLRIPTRTPPATETGGVVQHYVEVYFSGACDASGFGEGLASIAARTAPPESDAVVEIPLNDASDHFRRLAALGVYLTATVTQELSPSGGLPPVYRTSEFSECLRLTLPEDAAEAEVADGETGPVLDGPGVDVDVTANPPGLAARGAAASLRAAGTLYAARHDLAPDHNAFAGAATAPDGTTVTPDTVAARSWTLAAPDLDGLTYTACLDVDGLGVVPSMLVVVQRPRVGAPWTPHDATLDADTGRLCAGGLTAFGELGLGTEAAAAVAVTVVDGQPGWRMLAAPVDGLTVGGLAERNLVQGVPGSYPDAGANLYTGFDGAAFTPPAGTADALAPGRGFLWYLYDEAFDPGGASVSRALPMTLALGGDAPPAEVAIPLHAAGEGWNLLGNPFPFEIDVSAMASWAEGGALASAVGQVWDPNAGSTGSYVPTSVLGDRLPVWAGAFVQNADADLLRVPASAAAPGEGEGPEAPRLLAFELAGQTPAGAPLLDRALVAAFREGAGEGWDAFDAGKLTPLGASYVAASFGGERAGEPVAQAQASRALEPGPAFELPISVAAEGATGALVLSWPRVEVPDGWRLTLRDVETGEEVDLRAAPSYAFELAPEPAAREAAAGGAERQARGGAGSTGARSEARPLPPTPALRGGGAARLVLRVEPSGVVATEPDAPAAFALGVVRPNPARGSAAVEVALPEAAEVRVSVYDALGREVAVLADGERPAGRHALRVEAGRLAAGVYVVRMTAGDFVGVRRLTVVR